jgi:hypothetical protein
VRACAGHTAIMADRLTYLPLHAAPSSRSRLPAKPQRLATPGGEPAWCARWWQRKAGGHRYPLSLPSFRLLFRWEVAAIVGKGGACWRVGGRVWATTSFIYWTARAGQQGHRESCHSRMMQQLWPKRGRRSATRRSRSGRATAVWRPCCICRRSPSPTSANQFDLSRACRRRQARRERPRRERADPEWLSKVRSRREASILPRLPKDEREIAKALSIPPRMVEYLLSRPGWIPRL